MKLRRRSKPPPPDGYIGDHADKLSRVRGVSTAEDEQRPTGADRETYHSPIESIFEPVPFPRWLRPRHKGRKRSR